MRKYKTEQRKLMQNLFINHPHEMFSAKEIAEHLGNESVSMSAIYRNLSELETSGLVRRCAKSGSREAYYQYTNIIDCKDYIHLTCTRCGKTVHMALEDSDALAKSASKYKGFSIDRTETVLFGLCGVCRHS